MKKLLVKNIGLLATPEGKSAHRGEEQGKVKFLKDAWVLIEDGVIEEAAFTGHGCAVSQASADMMADLVTGETVEEARRLCGLFMKMVKGETLTDEEKEDLDEAAQLESISHMPARVKCAELGWRTLSEIIGE